jgi:hypothetical protein
MRFTSGAFHIHLAIRWIVAGLSVGRYALSRGNGWVGEAKTVRIEDHNEKRCPLPAAKK